MEKNKVTILAIDDNQDNLVTLQALIQDAFPEYVTLTAKTGATGIELAHSKDVDVILLDVLMPGMDGFAVCRSLKSDPKTSDIPVVFLTALRGNKQSRIQALEAGAEAFLTKPVDETELTAQIRAMLKIKTANDQKRHEKEYLKQLVAEQTRELQQAHTATLNLLEDLRQENEARKRHETALRESEERFRTIFEQVPFGITLTDSLNGKIYEMNARFAEITGRTRQELINLDWMRITHPDDVQADLDNMARMNAGETNGYQMEKRYVRPDDTAVWVNMTVAPIKSMEIARPVHLCMIEDITERKHTRAALESSQKLADIGTLTASIMHEIRSPLQVITGVSESLLRSLEKEPPDSARFARQLEMVNRNAWRIAGIANSLLRYARATGGEMEDDDINEIVQDTLLLIQHQLANWSNIMVVTDLATNPPLLHCDRNKIVQILINLLTNARDAMPQGGEIVIATQYDSVENRICLQVADQGAGIPESAREKIFNPFFTTKAAGQGTGLGLSIVREIVDAHHGQIEVNSAAGQGTAFRLCFPLNRQK